MRDLNIQVRGTYLLPPLNGDDCWANGGRFDGPRLFAIEYVETEGNAEALLDALGVGR